jgi:hypothetical protein
MLSLFGRAQKGKPVVVAHVESGGVAVGVAIIESEKPARFVASERVRIPPLERSLEQQTSSLLTALSDVLARVVDSYSKSESGKKYKQPTSVHVVVGSPWVSSRTLQAENSFDKEQLVTDAMIKSLAKQALSKKSTETLDQSRIFETSVTRVQLNGYPTGKPVGKKAHHLMVTVLQSEIDQTLKDGVIRTIGQILPGRDVDFRSLTGATLNILHERARTHHYLFIMVGSTSVDCVAIHKEDTNEHVSVPIGIDSIVKRIAGPDGLPDQVFSLMRMLMSDACNSPACETLKNNLAKAEPELVKAFGDVFAKVASYRRMPNTCFLAAPPDFAPWLEHFFSRIDFAQFTVTAQPLSVELLTPDHVRDIVEWVSPAIPDTGLAMAAVFANNIHHR